MTRSVSNSVAVARPSAHALLHLHARDRSTEPALIGVVGDVVVERTWEELALRVDRAAAGFLRADFRPHHVVILLMRPGLEAVEVELALRSIGVVALHVAPDVSREDLAPHLVGVRVRLVISDDAGAASRVHAFDLSHIEQLVLGGGANWDRVQALGEAYLHEQPTCVLDAAASTGPVTSTAVHVLRDADDVVVRRMPAVTAGGHPAETALLTGPAWDPRVAALRATQLASGGALAWTDDPAHLPSLLQHATPHVLATFTDRDEFAEVLRDVRVNGRAWHRSPVEALEAAVTVASGGHVGHGVRRRARSVESLRPWFGPRLRTVVLDRQHDPVLAAVAEVMGLSVLQPWPHELEAVSLPRVPSRPPPPVKPLPHRMRSDPDEAFRRLRALEAEAEADLGLDEAGLPSLSLLMGDSMLDRVLATQADRRKAPQTQRA